MSVRPVADDIKKHCLRLLACREHSQKELLSKLQQKGFDPIAIQSVLTELAESDLQSDVRFAENFARSRLRKGYGEAAICYELNKKGINFANEFLNDALTSVADNWLDLLTQTYCKKYGEMTPVSWVEWSKRYRFLRQRGFSSAQIAQFASESHIFRF